MSEVLIVALVVVLAFAAGLVTDRLWLHSHRQLPADVIRDIRRDAGKDGVRRGIEIGWRQATEAQRRNQAPRPAALPAPTSPPVPRSPQPRLDRHDALTDSGIHRWVEAGAVSWRQQALPEEAL